MRGELINGECIGEMKRLPDASVQLVIADPPYFNVLSESWDRQWQDAQAYLDWSLSWLEEAMRVLRDDGLLYCFGQIGKREHAFMHLISLAARRWQFHDLITWDRVVGYNERRDSFTPAAEHILVLRKGDTPKFHKHAIREAYDAETVAKYLKDKRYKDRDARVRHLAEGKFATNLWRIPSLKGASKEKCGHPSQKPLRLIERIILSSSDPGNVVLDPFLGSGSTAVAAEAHGRAWIGIEINPMYVELAKTRLSIGDADRLRKAS